MFLFLLLMDFNLSKFNLNALMVNKEIKIIILNIFNNILNFIQFIMVNNLNSIFNWVIFKMVMKHINLSHKVIKYFRLLF